MQQLRAEHCPEPSPQLLHMILHCTSSHTLRIPERPEKVLACIVGQDKSESAHQQGLIFWSASPLRYCLTLSCHRPQSITAAYSCATTFVWRIPLADILSPPMQARVKWGTHTTYTPPPTTRGPCSQHFRCADSEQHFTSLGQQPLDFIFRSLLTTSLAFVPLLPSPPP